MEKICLTTYIYGDTYQNYIPLILYSIGKSYPDYRVILFISGHVREDICESLKYIDSFYTNYKIVENYFAECKNLTPLKAKSFRWVLWDNEFTEFDYLYYIDSDILFVKEPMPLHEQHIKHMHFIGSDCVSNILRKKPLPNTDSYLFLSAVKYGGIKSMFRYPFTSYELRISGLHFVKVSTYFKYVNNSVRAYYKDRISSGKAFGDIMYANDETLLYHIMKKAGCDVSCFAIQQTSSSMFGFDNPAKKEFCPHHGLHLGIFRIKDAETIDWTKEQLDSEDYKYYAQVIKYRWLDDPDFKQIYPLFSSSIKSDFDRLFKYYNLDFKN